MHPNGVYAKLSQELAAAEARLVARLEAIEARLDRLLGGGDPQDPAAPPLPKKAG